MKNLKTIFALLALAGITLSSCKNDDDTPEPTITKIEVTGKVNDDSGAALANVTISSTLNPATTTSSTASGIFNIYVEKTDSLKFEKTGYESIKVAPAATLTVTLKKMPDLTFAQYFDKAGNKVQNTSFTANTITPTANLGTLSSYPAGFENVNFKGAVNPTGTAWFASWSFYNNIVSGKLTSNPISTKTIEVWNDAKMKTAGTTVNWTASKTYILEGLVFVNDGQTLNIEAGTIVQGKPGQAASASALIIARGGKINANGTAAAPIIFTFEGDKGNTPATLRGQWGGLIILGKAKLNSAPGITAIEGIPTNEVRGLYGGTVDNDNSGTLKYVSIRHGGTNIGADNEINGLTLGGVGSGTTIEYVEIIGNDDDGIEWFGGTVNGKYLVSAYCADDGLDYDEGYRGKNQFIVVHQDPTPGAADRGGEHDGGTDPETGTPYAIPLFYNVTSIGNPNSRTITFRDNAGGQYHNSIFVGYGRGVDIQDKLNQDQDSFKQWKDGNLKLENNIFHNIKAGTGGASVFTITN